MYFYICTCIYVAIYESMCLLCVYIYVRDIYIYTCGCIVLELVKTPWPAEDQDPRCVLRAAAAKN